MLPTTRKAWQVAQETNFKWYCERIADIHINKWIPDLDFFKPFLNHKDKVIVEIGCGPTGGLLKFMEGKLRIGVEPLANRFLGMGFKNIAQTEILFLNAFGEEIPLVDGFADIVCLIHSLGHAQDPELILNEADRILKIGGEIYILEIIRKQDQITIDHPVSITKNDLFHWLDQNGYDTVKTDFSLTTRESDTDYPLFNGVFKKIGPEFIFE